jgi:hypothetical protein
MLHVRQKKGATSIQGVARPNAGQPSPFFSQLTIMAMQHANNQQEESSIET